MPRSVSTYLIEDLERMALAKNYLAWQARVVAPYLGRRVIEAGCGIGNFTASLLDRELVIAADPEADCIERLQRRYAGVASLQAVVCEIGDPQFDALASHRADSCVCLNVLEHVADDSAALRSMARVIQQGGAIVLLVPACPALLGPIDRNLGHYRRYRKTDLLRLAADSGLRIRKLRYMNAVGFFGWWFNARVVRRQAQSASQVRFFDRCIVPWLARLEGLRPPPFGQSIFAVLEKP